MAQRLEQLIRLFYGVESVEGDGTLGTANEALLVSELSKPTPRAFHERSFRGAMGTRQGKIGAVTGAGFGFKAELKGQGSSSLIPELDKILLCAFGAQQDDSAAGAFTGTTLAAGSTTTSLNVVSSASFNVGNAIAVEIGAASGTYEIAWISAIPNGTTITLARALRASGSGGPDLVATRNVRPSNTYKLADSGHISLAFQQWLDATKYLNNRGCKVRLKIEVPESGALPTATFDIVAMDWIHPAAGTRPAMTVDTGLPPVALASVVKFDATLKAIRSFMIDLANEISPKRSQNSTYGLSGLVVADRKITGAVSVDDTETSEPEFTDWQANTQVDISMQWGNERFKTVALRVPFAERSAVNYGEAGKLTTDEMAFNANISSGTDALYLAFL